MRTPIAAGFALSLLAGCALLPSDAPKATADLAPTKGSTVHGTVNFVEGRFGVQVHAAVSGLKPNSEFGFHLHEAGDCSSGDGMSAKGHFNPYSQPHAQAGMPQRHAGDLPSIRSDANGNATLVAKLDVITVSPGPASVIDRGVIVHAQADDFTTQPTGNAGARSACGVVKAYTPPVEGKKPAAEKPAAVKPAAEKPAAGPEKK